MVSTLYRRHESTPAYSVAVLRRVMEAIAAEFLVIDATPTELDTRTVHASKIEYPGAVFPYLNERRVRAYAAEPGEPMFGELVGLGAALNSAFESERPAAASALRAHRAGVYGVLQEHWVSAAAVNDSITDQVMAAKGALESALIGPAHREGSERWDGYAAEVAWRATSENPGRRVLMLTGVENAPRIRRLVSTSAGVNAIDVGVWLAQRGL